MFASPFAFNLSPERRMFANPVDYVRAPLQLTEPVYAA
jgi:hypothetical protein